MKKKKKLRGILGCKKAMRARHGKQTCFFFWPNWNFLDQLLPPYKFYGRDM